MTALGRSTGYLNLFFFYHIEPCARWDSTAGQGRTPVAQAVISNSNVRTVRLQGVALDTVPTVRKTFFVLMVKQVWDLSFIIMWEHHHHLFNVHELDAKAVVAKLTTLVITGGTGVHNSTLSCSDALVQCPCRSL